MIFFVRTISIAPGKNADAMAFAHKVTQYVKDEFESAMTQLIADSDWQKLVAGNAANIIPGSVHDEVWRSL